VALGAPNGRCCESIGRIALTGRKVGYASTAIAVDSGCASITVFDVGSRRTVLVLPQVACSIDAGIIKQEEVANLLVSSRGSVAWIVSRGRDGRTSGFDVHSADAHGPIRVLDKGIGIDPKSLRLVGNTLTWENAGQPMSSNLR
jgi:hypothetical protein